MAILTPIRGLHLSEVPSVLHKCANPACLSLFRKLSQGKLFLVETEPSAGPEARGAHRKDQSSRRIEYYWLCDQCAFVLTLSYEKGRGVVTVPRPVVAKRRLPAVHRAVEKPIHESNRGEQSAQERQ